MMLTTKKLLKTMYWWILLLSSLLLFTSFQCTNTQHYQPLSWSGGDCNEKDTVYYDVFFATDSIKLPIPNMPVMIDTLCPENMPVQYDTAGTLPYRVYHNIVVTHCISKPLNPLTTYYWQVIATDNHKASTCGPVWRFTTGKW